MPCWKSAVGRAQLKCRGCECGLRSSAEIVAWPPANPQQIVFDAAYGPKARGQAGAAVGSHHVPFTSSVVGERSALQSQPGQGIATHEAQFASSGENWSALTMLMGGPRFWPELRLPPLPDYCKRGLHLKRALYILLWVFKPRCRFRLPPAPLTPFKCKWRAKSIRRAAPCGSQHCGGWIVARMKIN